MKRSLLDGKGVIHLSQAFALDDKKKKKVLLNH